MRQTVAGDACIRCGAALEERKAIELASFDPGRPMADLHVTNAAAQEVAVVMSACRITPTHILTAAALMSHDGDGLILPQGIAPFDVIVTPANYGDAAQREAAHTIYTQCRERGLDALLDDRDERPGVKFKDADLIGVPYRITVGKKLASGLVEVVERKGKRTNDSAIESAAAAVLGNPIATSFS